MTIRIDHSKKILLDADVIIHFIKGEQIGILNKIFPNKLYILDVVFSEVFKGAQRPMVENLIKMRIIEELSFDNDLIVIKEYARLKKLYNYGDGESACMAYCKYHKDVLASSNLKDIKLYCEENEIQYLTTMDFIHQAYINRLMDEAECDYFIYNVKSKGSKLPVSSIKEYINKFKP
ncbi:hypothetical protein DSECCO2_164940 [anaerobic digester metagenome]